MVEEVESWAKRMLLPLMEKMKDVTSQEENVNVTLRVQACEGCHGTNHSCTNPGLCVPWLSPKLPWFSQHYTPPSPGLLVCPSPQDHSPPRNFWESVWQDKITMECWSYQPLGSLQALVNAAFRCNLATPSLRESHPPAPRIPVRQKLQILKSAGHQGEPTPLHPHSHPALLCGEVILGVTQISPAILLALRRFCLDTRGMPVQSRWLFLSYSDQANIVSHILLIAGSTICKANYFLFSIIVTGPGFWLQFSLVGSFAHGIYPALYHPRSMWTVFSSFTMSPDCCSNPVPPSLFSWRAFLSQTWLIS